MIKSRSSQTNGKAGFLTFWLAIALSAVRLAPTVAAAAAAGDNVQASRQTKQPVMAPSQAQSQKAGIIAWLESLLPSGIRLSGPAILSGNQPEVLATANCYDSGAGMSCNGFRNMREYLAAVHASQNLGIPFERLKARIEKGSSLHEAIRALRPTVDAQIETLKAQQEAERTLRSSST